jgi:hypothetical protein
MVHRVRVAVLISIPIPVAIVILIAAVSVAVAIVILIVFVIVIVAAVSVGGAIVATVLALLVPRRAAYCNARVVNSHFPVPSSGGRSLSGCRGGFRYRTHRDCRKEHAEDRKHAEDMHYEGQNRVLLHMRWSDLHSRSISNSKDEILKFAAAIKHKLRNHSASHFEITSLCDKVHDLFV